MGRHHKKKAGGGGGGGDKKTTTSRVLKAGENTHLLAMAIDVNSHFTQDGDSNSLQHLCMANQHSWMSIRGGQTTLVIDCSKVLVPNVTVHGKAISSTANPSYVGKKGGDILPVLLEHTDSKDTGYHSTMSQFNADDSVLFVSHAGKHMFLIFKRQQQQQQQQEQQQEKSSNSDNNNNNNNQFTLLNKLEHAPWNHAQKDFVHNFNFSSCGNFLAFATHYKGEAGILIDEHHNQFRDISTQEGSKNISRLAIPGVSNATSIRISTTDSIRTLFVGTKNGSLLVFMDQNQNKNSSSSTSSTATTAASSNNAKPNYVLTHAFHNISVHNSTGSGDPVNEIIHFESSKAEAAEKGRNNNKYHSELLYVVLGSQLHVLDAEAIKNNNFEDLDFKKDVRFPEGISVYCPSGPAISRDRGRRHFALQHNTVTLLHNSFTLQPLCELAEIPSKHPLSDYSNTSRALDFDHTSAFLACLDARKIIVRVYFSPSELAWNKKNMLLWQIREKGNEKTSAMRRAFSCYQVLVLVSLFLENSQHYGFTADVMKNKVEAPLSCVMKWTD